MHNCDKNVPLQNRPTMSPGPKHQVLHRKQDNTQQKDSCQLCCVMTYVPPYSRTAGTGGTALSRRAKFLPLTLPLQHAVCAGCGPPHCFARPFSFKGQQLCSHFLAASASQNRIGCSCVTALHRVALQGCARGCPKQRLSAIITFVWACRLRIALHSTHHAQSSQWQCFKTVGEGAFQ